MRNAPAPPPGRSGIERGEVDGLLHAGIRKSPHQRCNRQICRHQHDGIGERRHGEAMQQDQVVPAACPARGRPGRNRDQHRAGRQHDGRSDRIGAAQSRPAGEGQVPAPYPFRQVTQRFAGERVAGLHGERVERPETGLGDPKQRSPSDPSQRDDRDQSERRADPGQRGKPVRQFRKPGGRQQRRQTQQHCRQQQQHRPGKQQFRQTDFDQQAAGDREQGPLPGTGGIVLDIAVARIDQHAVPDCRRTSVAPLRRRLFWAPLARCWPLPARRGVAVPWYRQGMS